MDMDAPAVDALLKTIWPPFRTMNVCTTLLLLATPAPLIISSPPNVPRGEMLKRKELEFEVNMMLFTSTEVGMSTSLCEDWAKVAISDGPLGGPPGVQLLAFSQAESCGDSSQVALPARLT